MSSGQAFLADIAYSYRKHKELAEQAVGQIDDDAFFHKPAEQSNSIALIVKHVAGNLRSRWTDFLTSDGDKPWRDRDNEFVLGGQDTRQSLLRAWDDGWGALFQTLGTLSEQDLLKTVKIRGEDHTVMQALVRNLAHTAYHVGQIVYLAKLQKTEGWRWLTIPPGQSQQYKAEGKKYLK
jgi:uncharacterized damage-inducible protein DinB